MHLSFVRVLISSTIAEAGIEFDATGAENSVPYSEFNTKSFK
jgi:hypothetical protein